MKVVSWPVADCRHLSICDMLPERQNNVNDLCYWFIWQPERLSLEMKALYHSHKDPHPLRSQEALVVWSLSHVRLFATSWTVALQTSLSKGFPRQESWSGLPFPGRSLWPSDGTHISCIGKWILCHWAPEKHLVAVKKRHLKADWDWHIYIYYLYYV